jgi:hypothetical protein
MDTMPSTHNLHTISSSRNFFIQTEWIILIGTWSASDYWNEAITTATILQRIFKSQEIFDQTEPFYLALTVT